MTNYAYIATQPCGCTTYAAVDSPGHARDTAREVAACLRKGMVVERVTVEVARGRLKACKCGGEITSR